MDDGAGETITIELDLLKRDMAAGERSLARRPEIRRVRWLHYASQLVAILGLLGVGAAADDPDVGFIALVLVVAYGVFLQLWVLGQRKVSRDYRPSSVTFDELGFTSMMAGMVLRVPWSAPLDIEPGSRFIVLRLSPGFAHIWPRRCFAPGDDERVLAWARRARQQR